MKRFTLLKLALVGLTGVGLTGCFGSSENPTPRITEIPVSGAKKLDSSQEELFHTAKNLYSSGLYTVSRNRFESLLSAYPSGPYAEFASIKIADSYFAVGDYLGAAPLYENIAETYSSSKSSSYATAMAARSYHLAYEGIGRDTTPLVKAKELYDTLLTKETVYKRGAQKLSGNIDKLLLQHDMEILDFYERREHTEAYAARKEEFVSKWGSLPSEYQELADVEPTIVAMQAEEGDEEGDSARASFSEVEKIAQHEEPGEANRITGIKCSEDEKRTVVIMLSEALWSEDLSKIQNSATTESGTFKINLGSLAPHEDSLDCFNEADLVFDGSGELALYSDWTPDSNGVVGEILPPSIILTFKNSV